MKLVPNSNDSQYWAVARMEFLGKSLPKQVKPRGRIVKTLPRGIALALACALLGTPPVHATSLYDATWVAGEFQATLAPTDLLEHPQIPSYHGSATLPDPLEATVDSLSSRQHVAVDGLRNPHSVEFSSLFVDGYDASGLPFLPTWNADNAIPLKADDNPAAMPLVALAWLLGIGIIGMGMVGRRKKP